MSNFLPQTYWIFFAAVAGFISLVTAATRFTRCMDNIDRAKMHYNSIAFPKPFRIVLLFALLIAITCANCAGRAPERIQRNNFTISDTVSISPEAAEKIFMKAFDNLSVNAKYRILSDNQK